MKRKSKVKKLDSRFRGNDGREGKMNKMITRNLPEGLRPRDMGLVRHLCIRAVLSSIFLISFLLTTQCLSATSIANPSVTWMNNYSVSIEWKTDDLSHGGVVLITDNEKELPVIWEKEKQFTHIHKVLITDLKSSEKYSYYILSVSTKAQVKSELYHLTTPQKGEKFPAPSSDTTSPGSITLKWRTESEQDNYGFYLYRSLSDKGPWEKVNDKIVPGHGTTSEPHDYSYVDKGIRKNTRYYYQLEYIDLAGNAERKPYTIKGMDTKPVKKDQSK
jgi:hypothetical protein